MEVQMGLFYLFYFKLPEAEGVLFPLFGTLSQSREKKEIDAELFQTPPFTRIHGKSLIHFSLPRKAGHSVSDIFLSLRRL